MPPCWSGMSAITGVSVPASARAQEARARSPRPRRRRGRRAERDVRRAPGHSRRACHRAFGHARQRRGAREEIGEDRGAPETAARGIEVDDPRQVIRRRDADHDAVGRRDGSARTGAGVPARERIDVAEAERQIDRAAELGGVEARGGAAVLDLGDAARQQARAEPCPRSSLVTSTMLSQAMVGPSGSVSALAIHWLRFAPRTPKPCPSVSMRRQSAATWFQPASIDSGHKAFRVLAARAPDLAQSAAQNFPSRTS